MRDARQMRGGERRRWDGGEEERKTQEPRTGQFTAARGRTCALAVSQTILLELDAAQTVARRVLASSGTPRTVRITRGKKLRRNVFSWLAARRSFFPTIGRRFAQRSRVALAFYLVPPWRSRSRRRARRHCTPHVCRPPLERDDTSGHIERTSRASPRTSTRARFPAHRALERPGRRFLAFRPSFGTSPRAR